MKKKVSLIFLVSVFLVVGLFSANGLVQAADVLKLTIAGFTPPGAGAIPSVTLDKYKEELEKRTKGKIKITVFHGGTLLHAKNMWEGLQKGVANMGSSCMAYTPGRFPLLALVDLPHGFANTAVSSRVLWDLYKKFEPEEFAAVKVLYLYTSGVGTDAGGIYSKFPVRSLEDLKGREIRATGVGSKALELLGATPVAMPMPEVYEALSKGIVEGVYTSFDPLKAYNHAELVKYVTPAPNPTASFYVAMNYKTWNSLPPDIKKVLDDLGEEMSIWSGETFHKSALEGFRYAIEKEGCEAITLSAEEKARWTKRFEPLINQYLADMKAKGLPGQAYLDELYLLKEKYEKIYK